MRNIIINFALPIRLDRYLKKIYPDLSQGLIEKALRLKQIKVNDQKSLSSVRIKEGDQITFNDFFIKQNSLEDNKQNQNKEDKFYPKNVIKLAEKINTEYLLYEDENLLIINKPNNLAAQGGSKIKISIDDALNYLNQQQGKDLKLVHRLDKETSGCFVIAKNYFSSVKLGQAFKDKIINKIYHAITFGSLPKNNGEITNLITKKRGGIYETVIEDKNQGKLAITQYKLLKKYGDLSYIEFRPLTGRMHQLRFHARALGVPILGDYKYGCIDNSWQAANMSDDMLLHAAIIVMPASLFGKEIFAEAPLPSYFKKFMK